MDFLIFDKPKDTSKVTKEALNLKGLEEVVDHIVNFTEVLDTAQAEIDKGREKLDAEVKALRLQAERMGRFSKTVYAHGIRHTVCYDFKNAFKTLPTANEHPLRQNLGDSVYESLFRKTKCAKVREGKLEALLAKLGPEAAEFLDVEEKIATVPNFMETRFELRGKLGNQVNETIDELTTKISQRPALSVK